MKQIVTINLNHICPMVTGLVPHVGGPPDTIIQGYPGMLIDGVPVAVQGSMTAHGGMIPMGVPGVTVGSATPVKPITMNIKRIPFPEIRTIDRVGAAVTGNSASLKEAEKNIKELKEEATQQEPKIYNLRWERKGIRTDSERIDEHTKMVADTANILDGEIVKIKVFVNEDSNSSEELDGVVKDGIVEIGWDVLHKHFKGKE